MSENESAEKLQHVKAGGASKLIFSSIVGTCWLKYSFALPLCTTIRFNGFNPFISIQGDSAGLGPGPGLG